MAGKKNRSKAAQNSVSAGSKGVNVPTNSIKKDADELLAMTKEQLKIECRKRGQKTSGNKAELVWDRSEWEAGKMEQVVCVGIHAVDFAPSSCCVDASPFLLLSLSLDVKGR